MIALGGGFVISCMVRASGLVGIVFSGFLGVLRGGVQLCGFVFGWGGVFVMGFLFGVVGVHWSWGCVGFTCFLFGLGLGWRVIVFLTSGPGMN